MENIRGRFLPSVQTMELMHPLAQSCSIAEAAARLSDLGYYRSIETAVLCDRALSARMYNICAGTGLRWTCWASPFINAEALNISSLDREVWERSLERLTELLKTTADAGANAFSILSGRKPEAAGKLPEALRRLEEGMLRLADCAAGYPQFSLFIEPLDRDVHKCGTLGTSQEAAALIEKVRLVHPKTAIVWDSAHFSLQEGDLSKSLRTCGGVIGHIHLCNAILQQNAPLYGDYHIMPGGRGYLHADFAARLLVEAVAILPDSEAIPLAVEARAQSDTWQTEAEIRHFLERVFTLAEELTG